MAAMMHGEAYIIYGKAGTGNRIAVRHEGWRPPGSGYNEPQACRRLHPPGARRRTTRWASSVSGCRDINATGWPTSSSEQMRAMMPGRPISSTGKPAAPGRSSARRWKTARFWIQRTSNTADGFILQSDAADNELGRSVSGAGDINGDGFDDLIVGAPFGDDGGDRAGEAYNHLRQAGTSGTQFGTKVGDHQVLDTTSLSLPTASSFRAMRGAMAACSRATSWAVRFREPAISMATGWPTHRRSPSRRWCRGGLYHLRESRRHRVAVRHEGGKPPGSGYNELQASRRLYHPGRCGARPVGHFGFGSRRLPNRSLAVSPWMIKPSVDLRVVVSRTWRFSVVPPNCNPSPVVSAFP